MDASCDVDLSDVVADLSRVVSLLASRLGDPADTVSPVTRLRTTWAVTARPPRGKDGRYWQLRYWPPPGQGRPGKPGKPYQRSAGTEDGDEAWALARREQARLNGEGEGFRAVAEAYLKWCEGESLAQRTLKRYRNALAVVCEHLDEVSLATVQETRDALRDRLAPSTATSYLGIAKAAWQWGVDRGLAKVAWPRVRPPRSKPTSLRPPTAAELARIVEKVKDYEGGIYWPLFATLIETGARSGETCAVRERDVDRSECVIYFRRQWKGEASRRAVPVSRELIELLPKRDDPDAYLFVGKRSGVMLSSASVGNVWRRCVLRAGLEDERLGGPHALRRAWVTAARAAGVRPELSMRIGGHSDLGTHLRYARNAVDRESREAAKKIRGALASPPHGVSGSPTEVPTDSVGGGACGVSVPGANFVPVGDADQTTDASSKSFMDSGTGTKQGD